MGSTPSSSTVLVVDDDQGLARLITKSLARDGFAVATAATAGAALAWLDRNQADLVLLDLKLPDLPTPVIINQLAKGKHPAPFIIITGQGDERVAVEMMKQGAADYLVKGGDFLELMPAVVERAIARIRREKEHRQLERDILRISEMERQRIGQDLHDGLCQHLAGIECMSQALEEKLARKSKADAARAGEIARLVRQAISQTRSVARGLSPVVVDAAGLMSALQELATATESRFQTACAFCCETPVQLDDNAMAVHLYRIAQEAVGNAIKHAQAKRIEVRLATDAGKIVLEVRDDGLGIPADPRRTGMGLRTMNYRAGMIGATLAVRKLPAGGTSVVCSLQQPSQLST